MKSWPSCPDQSCCFPGFAHSSACCPLPLPPDTPSPQRIFPDCYRTLCPQSRRGWSSPPRCSTDRTPGSSSCLRWPCPPGRDIRWGSLNKFRKIHWKKYIEKVYCLSKVLESWVGQSKWKSGKIFWKRVLTKSWKHLKIFWKFNKEPDS